MFGDEHRSRRKACGRSPKKGVFMEVVGLDEIRGFES